MPEHDCSGYSHVRSLRKPDIKKLRRALCRSGIRNTAGRRELPLERAPSTSARSSTPSPPRRSRTPRSNPHPTPGALIAADGKQDQAGELAQGLQDRHPLTRAGHSRRRRARRGLTLHYNIVFYNIFIYKSVASGRPLKKRRRRGASRRRSLRNAGGASVRCFLNART